MKNFKKTGIVDIIIFFEPYGVELLDFRINLLKDHVDWFIVTECDRTQIGEYCGFKFEEVAERLQLPMEKIIYVKKEIPNLDELEILDNDVKIVQYCNRVDSPITKENLISKAIERTQKNAFLDVVDEFDYNTLFLFGDSDEIINPKNIDWIARLCRNNKDTIIKIPLMYLQGRADLRTFDIQSNKWEGWNNHFMMTNRYLLDKYSPDTLRFHIMHYHFPTHNGELVENLGWHFRWMGGKKKLLKKFNSYTHRLDSSRGIGSKDDHQKLLENTCFSDGSPTPDGKPNHILKKINLEELPDLLFSKREYIDFFFGLK